MKVRTVLLGFAPLVLGVANLSAASVILKKDYEAILDCPAAEGAPNFMVVRKGQTFFLQTAFSNKAQVFELEIHDRDFGHMTYSPVDPKGLGELSKFVSLIHVYNNGADIDDPDQATVTSGAIEVDGRDQLCDVVGEPQAK